MPINIVYGVNPNLIAGVAADSGYLAGNNQVRMQDLNFQASRSNAQSNQAFQREMSNLSQAQTLERMDRQAKLAEDASDKAFGRQLDILAKQQGFQERQATFGRDFSLMMQDDQQAHALNAMQQNAEVSKAIMLAKREADVESYKEKSAIERARLQERKVRYEDQMKKLDDLYSTKKISSSAYNIASKDLNSRYGDVAGTYIPKDEEIKEQFWETPTGEKTPMYRDKNGNPDPATTQQKWYEREAQNMEIELKKSEAFSSAVMKNTMAKSQFIRSLASQMVKGIGGEEKRAFSDDYISQAVQQVFGPIESMTNQLFGFNQQQTQAPTQPPAQQPAPAPAPEPEPEPGPGPEPDKPAEPAMASPENPIPLNTLPQAEQIKVVQNLQSMAENMKKAAKSRNPIEYLRAKRKFQRLQQSYPMQ